MYEDGHLVLIDMGAARCGHPIFDLMSVGLMREYVDGVDDNFTLRYDGKTCEQIRRTWDTFLKVYFHTQDEMQLAQIHRILMCYSAIRCWMVAALVSQYSRRLVQYSMDTFDRYYGQGDLDLHVLDI